MRTFLYIGIGAVLLALAMFLSGPTIKASGTAWRASHRAGHSMTSDTRPAKHWGAHV